MILPDFVPDINERNEAMAERWADENIRGDEFHCSCGKWWPLDDGTTAIPNPCSPLICPECDKAVIEDIHK